MTREQLLSGAIFKLSRDRHNYTCYQFEHNAAGDSQPGYLVMIQGITIKERAHHVNIMQVTATRMQVYTSICGGSVKVWRNLADYVIVEDSEPVKK